MVNTLIDIGNAIFDSFQIFGDFLTTPIVDLLRQFLSESTVNNIILFFRVFDLESATVFSFTLSTGIITFCVVTLIAWILKAIPIL